MSKDGGSLRAERQVGEYGAFDTAPLAVGPARRPARHAGHLPPCVGPVRVPNPTAFCMGVVGVLEFPNGRLSGPAVQKSWGYLVERKTGVFKFRPETLCIYAEPSGIAD